MCPILCTLLMLPCIASAELYIDIHVDKTKSEAFIQTEGEIREIIPEEERKLWNLWDLELKDAVDIYSDGLRPDEVFLSSPKLSEDPYKSNHWRQVNRTLAPVTVRIISITELSRFVYNQSFNNTNNRTVLYPFVFPIQVQQTVLSSWTVVGPRLTLGNGINYNLYFKFGRFGAEDNHKFSFTSPWGENKFNIKRHTVDFKNGLNKKKIPAGHTVTASLTINRHVMELQVDYRATLSGYVACKYPGETPNIRYYPINSLLTADESPTEFSSTEYIKIGFISDTSINVIDDTTSQVLSTDAVTVN